MGDGTAWGGHLACTEKIRWVRFPYLPVTWCSQPLRGRWWVTLIVNKNNYVSLGIPYVEAVRAVNPLSNDSCGSTPQRGTIVGVFRAHCPTKIRRIFLSADRRLIVSILSWRRYISRNKPITIISPSSIVYIFFPKVILAVVAGLRQFILKSFLSLKKIWWREPT